MTTIACNEYGMASDTMMTGNYIDQINIKKIHKINNSFLGFAGNPVEMKKFIDWYKQCDEEEYPEFHDDFTVLELKEGKIYFYDNSGGPLEVGTPAAIGTGSEIAMGAMMAGATPSQAVRIAIALDIQSGGGVDTLGKMKLNRRY